MVRSTVTLVVMVYCLGDSCVAHSFAMDGRR